MLDFIVKMFAWKAEWEVKKEYDKVWRPILHTLNLALYNTSYHT